MQQYPGDFEERWKRLETNAYAKMLALSKTQILTLASANRALKESLHNWFEQYNVDGSWLSRLKNGDRDKGERFERVLKSMCFEKEIINDQLPKNVVFTIPIILSLISGGIVVLNGADLIKKLVALILPSAILIPIMNSLWENQNKATTQKMIKGYITQLASFKNDLEGILK